MAETEVLAVDTLRDMVARGDVDTVVVAFPDLVGRLVGKRVTGSYFCDEVLEKGIAACDYLLTVDVDMTPQSGFEFADWDTGYGDVRCRPDASTLRLLPWLEKTALVLCDLFDEESGAPVGVAPRQILRRQVERAREAGYLIKCGSELEFVLFRESYEEAQAKGYTGLTFHSAFVEDYHVLQTTRDEYVIRQIRNGMNSAGIPVESSKGEAARGQQEINLRYADALEMADRHVLYKNGAKEIAGLNGRSLTFMAKYSMDECGSSCHLHSSVWNPDGSSSLMAGANGRELSAVARGWLGGQIRYTRELAWCYAPTVNSYKRYQPGSWAPTALVWGRDNRTCAFRVVGRDGGLRVESRLPGADCNPYLAIAATIAAGLRGIEMGIDPGDEFKGNAYEAVGVESVPVDLAAALAALEKSELARAAFGDDVHRHLVTTGNHEAEAFRRAVTDWERRRSFEQY
jgi:glutamine synthetase